MRLILIVTTLLIFNTKAFAHGEGGGISVSIEGDLASGNHLHLPVRIESSGEILFGYEWPFSSGDEHEHEEGHDEGAESKSGNSNEFHIAPSILFGGDIINRIISRDVLTDMTVGVGTVTEAKNGKGFIHIKNSKLLFGLGIEIDRHLTVGAFGAGLGLAYTKNHTSYSEVQLNTLQERGREIVLPGNFQDFAKWRVNEKLAYATSGSIIFNLGIGIDPIIHGGAIASASGMWVVRLKKIDQNQLNVSISSSKSYSYGIEVDGVIFGLSTEKLKSAEKGLNFNINMNSPEVANALKRIYKGDFRAIQKLSENEDLVKSFKSSESISKGRGRTALLNIAYLFGVGSSKYFIDSFQTTLGHDQDEGFAYTSIITKEKFTRGILSQHKKEVDQFATTYVDEVDEHGREQFFSANFKWHYEKDEVRAAVVMSKLKELSLEVGIEKLNALKINNRRLGHFRISFDASFSESDIVGILNLLSQDKKFATLKKNATKNIENYLNKNSYEDLCPSLSDSEDDEDDKKSLCFSELEQQTSGLLAKMNKLSKLVVGNIVSKKHEVAVSNFSQIGSMMVKNQFIFKELVRGLPDVEISLSVEGEKVAKQKMLLTNQI
jgi:hypothetical protein